MLFSNQSRAHQVLPPFIKICKSCTIFKTSISLEESFSLKFFNTSSCSKKEETDHGNKKYVNQSNKLFQPQIIKKGVNYFVEECQKFYEEKKQSYYLNDRQFQIRDPRHTVDMLYTFEKEKDIEKFIVTTDSSHDGGYSSASLKITESGTGLFSGNISTVIPKTGNVKMAGWANFMSFRQMKSFGRYSYFNWLGYTHLVFKIRGDGRTYLMILNTPYEYENTIGYQFCHPLYTRGGPYWQISRVPFSHFFFGHKGRVLDNQFVVPLNKISKFGITIADGHDGPFKLEMDYIGLEKDELHKHVSPYEQYQLSKHIAT